MALNDILVCVDGTPAGEARMKLALALARASGAYLDGAVVMPAGDRNTGEGGIETTGAAVGEEPQSWVLMPRPVTEAAASPAAERAAALAERFDGERRLNGIPGEWHVFGENERDAFIDIARTVDLTILGQSPVDLPEAAAARFRPQDIVLAAGRPVLIVPYIGDFETVGRRPLVAWDGSREASRALNDALPLLAHAEAVTVIHVGGERSLARTRPSLDRVVRHLQRHGLTAQLEESVRGGIAVSDVLLSRAADLGTDLIVAGAYHHSPLRETLIGGISRELIEHMTVPVLMSH